MPTEWTRCDACGNAIVDRWHLCPTCGAPHEPMRNRVYSFGPPPVRFGELVFPPEALSEMLEVGDSSTVTSGPEPDTHEGPGLYVPEWAEAKE